MKGSDFMPRIVSVTLTDGEYEKAEKKAEECGLKVTQYVKRFLIGDVEFEERYNYLIKRSKEMPEDCVFTVKSMFKDWEEISKGVKLSLGRNFYELVKNEKVEGVFDNGKNASNVQLYIVKKRGE